MCCTQLENVPAPRSSARASLFGVLEHATQPTWLLMARFTAHRDMDKACVYHIMLKCVY